MGWTEYALAFALFFLSHSLPVRPPVRGWLVARLGQGGFTLAYSALSLVMLGWLVVAADRAPFVVLWAWAPWQSTLALVAMLAVCLLLALAVGRPNPFSFGGAGNDRFDPARPGVVRWFRHPILAALLVWAAVHCLANGDLAHVILFSAFALFALAGGRLVDRRKRREMGPRWEELRAQVAASPPVPRPLSPAVLVLRLAAGLLLYMALLALHPVIFGVSPLP